MTGFLDGRIPWTDIAGVVEGTLDQYDLPGHAGPGGPSPLRIEEVLDADARARRAAEAVVRGREEAA